MFYLTSVIYEEKPSAKSLDQCLARLANQEIHALESLYEQVGDRVYGYALSMVKNPHDAQDVVQELFTAVYDNIGLYRSQGKPMAWILTITRHLCLQKLREGKRYSALPESVGEEQTTDDSQHHAIHTENQMLLSFCMEKLSEEERQIVVLHVVGGLKHREIAQMMNLPLGSVLSKYRRTLKKLKEMLERGEGHE
jgi:RNA polymerase sigma-70 factor (ECF subfamily)